VVLENLRLLPGNSGLLITALGDEDDRTPAEVAIPYDEKMRGRWVKLGALEAVGGVD
jgi:hypothetical protein